MIKEHVGRVIDTAGDVGQGARKARHR
jgi:hypothetical protein